jgi:hypothetical protein
MSSVTGGASLLKCALQRHSTENSKQIFSETELRGHSPSFHIHVSMSDLYIPTIDLPILLQEYMYVDRSWEYPSHTVKKKDRKFPVPSRDVTTKLSLGRNNDVITELFLPGEFG